MNNVANVALSSVKQVLTEVKHSCTVWFDLLHPYSLLDTKGLLAALGVGDNTNISSTDPNIGISTYRDQYLLGSVPGC